MNSEALLLLYGLMDSAPPAFRQESFSSRPEFAALSMDKYSAQQGTDPTVAANNDHFQPVKQMQRTEVDSLEDSFKFAVGIAAPMSSSSTQKAKAKTAAANRSASGQFGGHASFEVPEEVLLRDVLYALQAIDSRYLYFDVAADRFQITRSVGVPTRTSRLHTYLPVFPMQHRARGQNITCAICLCLNSNARADPQAVRAGLVLPKDRRVPQAPPRRAFLWSGMASGFGLAYSFQCRRVF